MAKANTDLIDEDIEIADVEVGENEYLYVFTFVGVVAVSGCVIKCYPKYLLNAKEPKDELKQVLRVIERYNNYYFLFFKIRTGEKLVKNYFKT